mmetsp:Transcript_2917/g.6819  ORF Transcript_2917/g.6819 Transcript_2917/m.6819 type:complete len:81 (+) Transcript_2917:2192-2434(+)
MRHEACFNCATTLHDDFPTSLFSLARAHKMKLDRGSLRHRLKTRLDAAGCVLREIVSVGRWFGGFALRVWFDDYTPPRRG